MDKLAFEKLCEESFDELGKKIREKVPEFPEEKNIDNGNILSDEKILQLMDKPLPLEVNENYELYYVDDEGKSIVIDPRIEDSEVLDRYIEEVYKIIPNVPFDQYCGGIKRKQQEVSAAYTVCVVNGFLNRMYDTDIKEVTLNYDFIENKSVKPGGKTFSDVFKTVQEDATPIVKFLITCCFTVLSQSKEKNEALYINIVSQKDQEILEQMIREVKSLEFKCNNKVKKQESKLDRLKTIQIKDDEILDVLNKNGLKYKVLYKLNKLNSTNLDPTFAPTIKQSSRLEAKTLLEEGKILDNDYYKKYVSRQSRKAIRMLVANMKKRKFFEFSKICEEKSPNFDVLLPKN